MQNKPETSKNKSTPVISKAIRRAGGLATATIAAGSLAAGIASPALAEGQNTGRTGGTPAEVGTTNITDGTPVNPDTTQANLNAKAQNSANTLAKQIIHGFSGIRPHRSLVPDGANNILTETTITVGTGKLKNGKTGEYNFTVLAPDPNHTEEVIVSEGDTTGPYAQLLLGKNAQTGGWAVLGNYKPVKGTSNVTIESAVQPVLPGEAEMTIDQLNAAVSQAGGIIHSAEHKYPPGHLKQAFHQPKGTAIND